jgi:hypothetical protein
LLVGTIVSQRHLPAIAGKLGRNVAALAGILMILIPAVLYTGLTPFPGAAALAPCLGAGLLISAGETGSTIVGEMLSWRPVVFVGLISYSLYLWHWPILVFQNSNSLLLNVEETSRYGKLAVLVVSLILATLSWRFVETPFRKGRFRPARQPLFLGTAIACALLVICGVTVVASHGFSGRFSPAQLAQARYLNYEPKAEWREGSCFILPETSAFRPVPCLSERAGRPQYLLAGDSVAAQLYPGLLQEFPQINLSQATVAKCPLLLKPIVDPPFAKHCLEMSRLLYQDYLVRHPVDTVLLAANWEQADLSGIGPTVDWIRQHGMKVIVFGPTYMYKRPLPELVIASLKTGKSDLIEHYFNAEDRQLDDQMAALARERWKVPYVSIYRDLCSSKDGHAGGVTTRGCPVYAAPDVPLLFDTHHLTPEGSRLYAAAMKADHQLP